MHVKVNLDVEQPPCKLSELWTIGLLVLLQFDEIENCL